MYKVTLLKGDGIGPEVVEAARRCIEATGVQISWEERLIGETALKQVGALIPEDTLDSIRKNTVALKGPVTTPIGTGFRSVNVQLRKLLDLYVNLRPAQSFGIHRHYEKVDIIIVRENTEDLYAGIEFPLGDELTKQLIDIVNTNGLGKLGYDTAISLKTISRKGSERVIRYAFEYAVAHNRKKVSAVHKANILKCTDGLFLKIFREIAPEYPGIIASDYIVDNLSMQLVLKPEDIDVLVLPNLYGDIMSDLCAGLIGGLGIAPGANIGKDYAVFEPVHGSAPKYAGKNKVNPAATILSGVLMLKHLGEETRAERLEKAVRAVIRERTHVTYDLVPGRDETKAVSTSEMADAIIKKLEDR